MIPRVFSLGGMDAFHFVAQSAAYRGNGADFAVRARALYEPERDLASFLSRALPSRIGIL